MNQPFHEFAAGVGLGLAQALRTDTDVFLLGCTGILLGAHSKRLNGIGTSLALYVVASRVDKIAGHFARVRST